VTWIAVSISLATGSVVGTIAREKHAPAMAAELQHSHPNQ
jgi:hypothetical protein